jgi:DNA invertase Pin-like site-specific DNA recombinase
LILGYARVSTKEQNEDRQILALTEAGVEKCSIFIDKQSGKDFNRPGYRRMLRKLKPGDTLYIKSIDRLGRDYEEILEQWRTITKKKQAAIYVLDMPLLDTRQRHAGDLTSAFVADLVLQILAYVAQTEREFIRQRQAEGIAAAKERGVQFGRHPIQWDEKHKTAIKEYRSGAWSSRKAAAYCGVSHRTICHWAAREEATDDARTP